ncbi:hypothetical protein GCM10011579_084480 [Streptomyces albiflavescens]|uniref:Uncharacterized protein n=2 Tax=Streptomyces albiflavescens TaxID=1623582 RepID=A0A917YCL9_9ACTN|nr:hypothetical protein GCM10011579_084480 [Streptomyces albiflavescens]
MRVSRACHRGRVPRVVPVAAVRAGLFSMLGTAVAVTVHHLAFDSGPSWGMRVLAACLLFGVALPGAGQDKPLSRQLMLAIGTQAVVGYWFVRTDDAVTVPAHAMWPTSVHAGWPVVVAHVALTVLCAVLLHGVDTCRRRVLYAAGREWEHLHELVCRLFTPVRTPLDLSMAGTGRRPHPAPTPGCPVQVLLSDAVVRRGPPLSPLPLAV